MSEPTYRVDLNHHPEDGPHVCWRAVVVRVRDEELLEVKHGSSREEAFAFALQWVAGLTSTPERPSSVYLSEDGDLLDPAEVQR